MSGSARKGTKISEAEAKGLDRSKMGVCVVGPRDVEGQEVSPEFIECPWCGKVGRAEIDSDASKWLSCGDCGRPFKA